MLEEKDERRRENQGRHCNYFDKEKLVSLARQLKKTKMSRHYQVLSGDEANACLGGLIRTLKEEGISLKKVISVSALDGYMVDEYIFSSEMIQNFDIFKLNYGLLFALLYIKRFLSILMVGWIFARCVLGKGNIYGFLFA